MQFFFGVICAAKSTAIQNLIKTPMDVMPQLILAKDEDTAAKELWRIADERHPRGSRLNHIQVFIFSLSDFDQQELVRLALAKQTSEASAVAVIG